MDIIMGIVAGLAIAAVLVVILTLIFQWLWNTTAPEIFSAKSVTFWQALKILLLAGILFGGHRVVETIEITTPGTEASSSQASANAEQTKTTP